MFTDRNRNSQSNFEIVKMKNLEHASIRRTNSRRRLSHRSLLTDHLARPYHFFSLFFTFFFLLQVRSRLDDNKMGRGLAWTAEEAGDLAHAWIAATEDPVLGIDQTSTHFNQGMYSSFCSFAPDGACAKQYSSRGARPSRAKWDSISADCQKF